MGYVIRREDGMFVAEPGSDKSYTKDLQKAQRFSTRESANKNRCVENETVVVRRFPPDEALDMTVLPKNKRCYLRLTSDGGGYYKYYLHRGKTILGQCLLTKDTDIATAYAVSIYIGYRERGYGQKLIRQMLVRARKFTKGVKLYVKRENKCAIHVYNKFGFVISDKWGDDEYMMKIIF